MRPRAPVVVLLLALSCGGGGVPPASAPGIPRSTEPTSVVAPSPRGGASSAGALPAAPVPASPGCAQTTVELPTSLPPCRAPGALELRDASLDLAVQVTPSSARVKPGASIDFTFTMTNKAKAPLHLVLLEPPQPPVSVLQSLETGDRPIEMLAGAPPANPACAHVDCPLRAPPASAASPAEITLAPGGVARAHGTWRARFQTWPKTVEPVPCCQVDTRQPVDGRPLPPGTYRVAFVPPVSDDNGQLSLEHDEIQVEIAP